MSNYMVYFEPLKRKVRLESTYRICLECIVKVLKIKILIISYVSKEVYDLSETGRRTTII